MTKYSNILCFEEITPIMTTNGISEIKNICPGDKIFSYDEIQKKMNIDTVVYTARSLHNKSSIITFNNGMTLKSTIDHPFLVKSKGWCAVCKNGIKKMYGVSVNLLEIGDECIGFDKDNICTRKIASIDIVKCSELFYCIQTEKYHNFVANGIVVHDVNITRFSKQFLDGENVQISNTNFK